MEPKFLELAQVFELHERSLHAHGGTSGLRDRGLVESAVMQPQNDFFYANADFFGIAGAYAFHIAQAQAFLDGNKRTAIASELAFLEINGIATDADKMPLYEAMIAIAERRLDKTGLAALFRELFGPA